MSRRPVEPLLDHWLAEGPAQAPDRVLDAIVERLHREPQRPAWRLLGRPSVSNLKLVAALAAAIVVTVVGWNVVAPDQETAGVTQPSASPFNGATRVPPSQSPSPTSSASRTVIQCEDDLEGCAGPLEAGVTLSANVRPQLRFSTPGGWTNSIDRPTIYKLDPPDPALPYILIWTNVDIADPAAECAEPTPGAGVPGASVDQWIAFITTHPGLDASDPVALTMQNARGHMVDVTVADGWTGTCPGVDEPTVSLLAHTLTPPVQYGVRAPERLRLFFLEPLTGDEGLADPAGWPGNGGNRETVVIEIYGPLSQTAFDARMETVQPIIESLRFGCGPGVPRPCLNQ